MSTRKRKSNAVSTVTDESNDLNDDDQNIKNSPKPHTHHHHHHGRHRDKVADLIKTKRFMFFITIIAIAVGLIGYTSQNQDIMSIDITDISFDAMIDEFKELLPSGILKEARDAENDKTELSESFAVGNAFRKEGSRAKYPVVLIPGVISTGLESWGLQGTEECPSQQYFRKRLWGSFQMLRAMLLDKNCWLKHIMLDQATGLDPPNFKLRAAQGMEAADFFIKGYWIWNKIIENLAALGYDTNDMYVASYDWRLGYLDLEKRDKYFSNLKLLIEKSLKLTGEKSVLVGHSMGAQVIFYFMKWVEAEGFGNGGPSWVNDHISNYIDISGSDLGTPKSIVALLSGEMKDTVQLNALAVYGLEKFFSRRERADMLRSFGGIASMLPKGGDDLWGSLTSAPDDTANNSQGISYGNFIRFANPIGPYSSKNLTMSESIEFLFSQSPEWFVQRTKSQYSFGLARTRKQVEENEYIPSKWINPLEVALPNAPDMKIYCFYGVGKDTERSYNYQEETNKNATQLNVTIVPGMSNSVVAGQGDGTISLLTHTMCHKWKEPNSRFNPAKSPVKIVEMLHQPDIFDLRGGAKTAEHVDILGRTELNELVLRVVAGEGDNIQENYFSDLKDWVPKMDLGSDD